MEGKNIKIFMDFYIIKEDDDYKLTLKTYFGNFMYANIIHMNNKLITM